MCERSIYVFLSPFFSGCYDGNVYCFHLKTGNVIWNYQTGNAIKIFEIFCKIKETIFVGSYDCYIYCLSVKVYVHGNTENKNDNNLKYKK